MIASLALMTALGSPPAALPEPEIDYLVDRFRQACMMGKAKFAPGEIKQIDKKALKGEVGEAYSHIEHAQFYQLNRSEPAYLVNWERKPAGYYYLHGCAVIARDLPLVKAWEKILNTSFTPVERSRLMEVATRVGVVEYPLPEEGSKISIAKVFGSKFVALQVSAMSKVETRDWKGYSFLQQGIPQKDNKE